MAPSPFVHSLLASASLLALIDVRAQSPDAQASANSNVVALDSVQVVGRAQTLYKSETASVGTRTDTPLALVPHRCRYSLAN
jgi:iron complex outermembrane receptor protein